MPFVEIFSTPKLDEEKKQKLFHVTQEILAEEFRTNKESISIWLHQNDSENTLMPRGAGLQTMVFIVHCFSGRTIEQKRALYTCLYAAVSEIYGGLVSCQVTVEESPGENWGIRKGCCAADVLREGK